MESDDELLPLRDCWGETEGLFPRRVFGQVAWRHLSAPPSVAGNTILCLSERYITTSPVALRHTLFFRPPLYLPTNTYFLHCTICTTPLLSLYQTLHNFQRYITSDTTSFLTMRHFLNTATTTSQYYTTSNTTPSTPHHSQHHTPKPTPFHK